MKQNPFKEETLPAGLGKILVAHLIPDKKNPRKDLKKGDPEFEKISKSVEKFGQLDPIIFNTRTRKVIGGHQRLKVLDSKGYTELYTVTLGAYTWAFAEADLKELSDKEESAANIALNKAQGDWEMDQLTANLQELKLEGLLDVTGFDDKEFDAMIRELHKDDEPQDSEPQISRAEELRKEWGTELGQMWQCGQHRIICGDCTELTNVNKLMGGERADLCFTSPPYNAGTHGWETKSKYQKDPDDKKQTKYYDFLVSATEGILFYSDCAIINIQQLSGNKTAFIDWLYRCEEHLIDIAIWDKGSAAPAMEPGVMSSAFEYLVILSSSKQPTRKIPHSSWRGSIQNIHRGDKQTANKDAGDHRATFPLHLPEWGLKLCDDAKVILDPFLGSGTTMIACENLGRKCRGIEIDPGYVAVILQRYKDTFPGKEIRLIE